MRQVILDTETTGLSTEEGHRIIEIGCIELVNRKFTGQRYHQYINPQRIIDDGALAVHGITQEFLADKPTFAEVVVPFMAFIQGAELIIHNAPFDIGFINYELGLLGRRNQFVSEDRYRIIDTLVMARQLHAGQRNGLDALCKRYSIDNSQRELHGALLDAHLLAQVYLAMTGGQGSLFDDMQQAEVHTMAREEAVHVAIQKRNLRVLHASADELSQHQQQVENMRAKGKCLWVES